MPATTGTFSDTLEGLCQDSPGFPEVSSLGATQHLCEPDKPPHSSSECDLVLQKLMVPTTAWDLREGVWVMVVGGLTEAFSLSSLPRGILTVMGLDKSRL